jgi:putative spermidine/putrescine transport system permease protein
MRGRRAIRLLLLPAAAVLVAVFLLPLVHFLAQSLQPPAGEAGLTLRHFEEVLGDEYYWGLARNSFTLGAMVTAITLLAAYPAALVMVSLRGTRWFAVMAIAVFSPLLTSVIIRSYGWLYVLSDTGVVNWVLLATGLAEQPVRLIFNWTGTVIAMVHLEMPFMMFPILSVLMQQPPVLREAAQDLGANAFETWRRVVLPLSLPGVLAGCQIVFATSISAFASPTILGGGRVRVLPVSIYSSIQGLEWSVGAVQAVLLLGLSLLLVAVFTRALRTRSRMAEAVA